MSLSALTLSLTAPAAALPSDASDTARPSALSIESAAVLSDTMRAALCAPFKDISKDRAANIAIQGAALHPAAAAAAARGIGWYEAMPAAPVLMIGADVSAALSAAIGALSMSVQGAAAAAYTIRRSCALVIRALVSLDAARFHPLLETGALSARDAVSAAAVLGIMPAVEFGALLDRWMTKDRAAARALALDAAARKSALASLRKNWERARKDEGYSAPDKDKDAAADDKDAAADVQTAPAPLPSAALSAAVLSALVMNPAALSAALGTLDAAALVILSAAVSAALVDASAAAPAPDVQTAPALETAPVSLDAAPATAAAPARRRRQTAPVE
jgi:hypothetical protein